MGGVAHHELLEDVVLDGATQLRLRHALVRVRVRLRVRVRVRVRGKLANITGLLRRGDHVQGRGDKQRA